MRQTKTEKGLTELFTEISALVGRREAKLIDALKMSGKSYRQIAEMIGGELTHTQITNIHKKYGK